MNIGETHLEAQTLLWKNMEIVVHSNNWAVSVKVSKEIAPFQQARVRTPNKGVRCKT